MNGLLWYALQTKTQYERVVARSLHGKGFEEFVPLYKNRRRSNGTIREIEDPLFPGYVFCRFRLDDRLDVLRTSYVRSIVNSAGTPLPVEESEVEAVRAVINSGAPMGPHPFLKVGQWVRVDCGSMEGVEGVLISVRRQHRLVVSITLLERAVAVEIDQAWISPVPDRTPRRQRASHAAPMSRH